MGDALAFKGLHMLTLAILSHSTWHCQPGCTGRCQNFTAGILETFGKNSKRCLLRGSQRAATIQPVNDFTTWPHTCCAV